MWMMKGWWGKDDEEDNDWEELTLSPLDRRTILSHNLEVVGREGGGREEDDDADVVGKSLYLHLHVYVYTV